MNFRDILSEIILQEYSEKIINQVISKFQSEGDVPNNEVIRYYINRFNQIKDSPKITQKDITKYTWRELETVVDSNQPKRIKAGKVDPIAEDANMIYNQDGIRVYVGRDTKACIKYGNGYSFCISARSEGNAFKFYRYTKQGTPYFIFNDNLPKSNKNHVLVIFHYGKPNMEGKIYTVSNAENEGDIWFKSLDEIVGRYRWIKPVVNYIKPIEFDEYEKLDSELEPLRNLLVEYENLFSNIDYRRRSEQKFMVFIETYEKYMDIKNGKKKFEVFYIENPDFKVNYPEGYNTWSDERKGSFNELVSQAKKILKSIYISKSLMIRDLNKDIDNDRKSHATEVVDKMINRLFNANDILDFGLNRRESIINLVNSRLKLKDISDKVIESYEELNRNYLDGKLVDMTLADILKKVDELKREIKIKETEIKLKFKDK